MRPLTEMEFEKACRGANNTPIPNEYAWGNTTINPINIILNAGTSTETFTSGNCHYNYSPYSTPMRCGALATLTSNRVSAGATYYGVLEMTGNVSELAVDAGYTTGRAYTGTHGDGMLNTSFEYNVANWPLNTGAGVIYRGGNLYTNYYANQYTLKISDRSDANSVTNNARGNNGL